MVDDRKPPSDEELREAIFSEKDPAKLAMLMTEYYHDNDRAASTDRRMMYFHMGLLTGAILKLVRETH